MIQPKTIVVIGASEELTAHLRLLMRKAASELTHPWIWGEETHADLVVVDPTEFAGHMARDRTIASGVPCAVFGNDVGLEGKSLVLRLPLKASNVVQVLNAAASSEVDASLISHDADDFYVHALKEGVPTPSGYGAVAIDIWGEHRLPPAPVLGLDEVIRSAQVPELREKPADTLAPETSIERVVGQTARSEKRVGATLDVLRGPGPVAAALRAPVPDSIRQPLKAYLEGDLLWRLSQAQIDGAPALTLDPKRRLYYADGDLSELAPYCVEPPPRNAWRVLAPTERAQHAATPGRPYAELLWLDAVIKSSGRLASHLDPGGRYRLKQRIAIDPGFHSHGPIADALQQPARFNEIMAASGAPMEQVFDLVNAYDALGYVERQPRERVRAAPVPPPEPKPQSGLLARFKWPFGKG